MARGVSLHIGLNTVDPDHYQGWSGPLNACEADAEDLEALAAARGFTTHRMLTAKATRGNVTAALEEYAGALQDGDFLFLTYSGHGGQVPDADDNEPDGRDETWCLHDGQLIDDELHARLAAFRAGVRVVVLSDSCHSGSVTRDVFLAALREAGVLGTMTAGESVTPPAVREMPASVALRVYRKNMRFYTDLQAKVPPNVVAQIRAHVLLISGCMDNQLSSDGTFNGLFTANLLRVWNKGVFRGDYRKLHQAIVARMPPVQTPNYFRLGPPSTLLDEQVPFTI